ncbi:MAG: CvpA family protein [Proteobacteria bacterium]|nr:CvpA family protein [Pseudomonadota bacterium]
MVYFDVFVFCILIFSALIGLVRGLTREVLGLCSWAAALTASYYSFNFANSIVLQYIQNPQIAQYVTYFAVFVAFLILFSIVSSILSSFIRQTVLSGIDRTLGFGFGLARAFVLLAVMDLSMGMFFPKDTIPPFLQNSKTITHLHLLGEKVLSILPKNIQVIVLEKQKSPMPLKKDQPLSKQDAERDQEDKANSLANLKPQVAEPQVEESKSPALPANAEDVINKAIDTVDKVSTAAKAVVSNTQ